MSMAGYTKLFNSILASTIWREDDKTRIVWITLLAMADKHGVAEGSVPGLADFARVSIEDCRKALFNLQKPDKDSRSKEFDGRRIEEIDGGWRILNHGKYRERLNADERREYLRQKQQEYRRRKSAASTTVNNVSDTDTLSTQAEADTDTEATPEAKAESRSREQKQTGVAVNGRSKRPIFQGQRFVVFDWQLEDLGRLLGPHLDAFDLHAWFFELDKVAVESGDVVPQRDGGKWLQARTLEEAQRRGLPVTSVTTGPQLGKQSTRLLAAVNRMKDTV